jgi:CRISPR-associated protein Csd1
MAQVRYIADLDEKGRLLRRALQDTRDTARPRGSKLLVPQILRSNDINPVPFASNAEYTFGLARDLSKARRVRECHTAYLEAVKRCAESTNLRSVRAVERFLNNRPLSRLTLPEDFDPGAAITFRTEGVMVADLSEVQSFWAREQSATRRSRRVVPMQCMVCGKKEARGHPQAKIRGIPGGHPSGAVLASAYEDAFHSYGLSGPLVAPTCPSCKERFTRTLNHLLESDDHHFTIGKFAVVFWTSSCVDFPFREYLLKPRRSLVGDLLDRIHSPTVLEELKKVRFHTALLSANGARLVVRDWIQTTLDQASSNIGQWFKDLAIVAPRGEDGWPISISALARGLERKMAELDSGDLLALIHTAISGAVPPLTLLYRALHKNRLERRVTNARAALIKLIMLRHSAAAFEFTLARLDQRNRHPAYLCGRLVAMLEAVQNARFSELPLGAGMVLRAFPTASYAPLWALVHFLQTDTAGRPRPEVHGPRLSDIRPMIDEITKGFATLPEGLTLMQQGLSALGYYHQRGSNRRLFVQSIVNDERTSGVPEEPE